MWTWKDHLHLLMFIILIYKINLIPIQARKAELWPCWSLDVGRRVRWLMGFSQQCSLTWGWRVTPRVICSQDNSQTMNCRTRLLYCASLSPIQPVHTGLSSKEKRICLVRLPLCSWPTGSTVAAGSGPAFDFAHSRLPWSCCLSSVTSNSKRQPKNNIIQTRPDHSMPN